MNAFNKIYGSLSNPPRLNYSEDYWYHIPGTDYVNIPVVTNRETLFYALHEIGHYYLHTHEVRLTNEDAVRQEIEADTWAYNKLKEFGYKPFTKLSNCTYDLICAFLLTGGQVEGYAAELQGRFVILYKDGKEVYSIFKSLVKNNPNLV